MGRPKKKTNLEKLKEEYALELQNNPELSLSIDPTNKYKFDDTEKKFIEAYIQTKNVGYAISVSEMDESKSMGFLMDYRTQSEIRRINKAICQLQFQTKMVTLDEIGGYLTALLEGNAVLAEQPSMQDKMKIVEMLLKVHQIQQDAIKEPQTLLQRDLNIDLSKLSTKTIKALIDNYKVNDIDEIMNSNMTPEEIANLKTQSKSIIELMKMLNK